jgi:hypothetical protein
MRGALINALFLIKGVFQILGLFVIFLPFEWWHLPVYTFPSSVFVYYLINVVILLTGMVIFGMVANKYRRLTQSRIDYDNIVATKQ